jgi:hypothetical protein
MGDIIVGDATMVTAWEQEKVGKIIPHRVCLVY